MKYKLLLIFGIAAGLLFAIIGYNETFGRYCNADLDCQFICGPGAVNNNYIYMDILGYIPGLHIDCFGFYTSICENNRCKKFSGKNATSVEDCERVTELYMKSECYFNVAKKLNDKSLCQKIEHEFFNEGCNFELAEELNINYCKELRHFDNECFSRLARALKDLNLCENIPYSFGKSSCYYEFAVDLNDVSVCIKIEDEFYKDYCYSKLAEKLNDTRLCDKISDSYYKKECIKQFEK